MIHLLTEPALLSHCATFLVGLTITTSTTFIFRLASLRFLLFTFNSSTHLFWTFLLFYSIHCWVHPSIFFSGCLNSFRGLDQFQPLFQASILRPNRDTFRELLCTCSGKTYKHNRKQAWSRVHTSNRMDVICISPQSPSLKTISDRRFFSHVFAKNSLIKNILEEEKKFDSRTLFFWGK